ncbi:MAG: flagellar hook capping FlgD N-terminal domain-containing protein [bacterium]
MSDVYTGLNVAVSDTYSAISNPSNTREVSSELGKDDFLMLLVTQLQYQDPLNPMDNTDFIAQMAQFTSLEQMQNLNQTMTNAQAYGIIGDLAYIQSYNSATGQYEITGGIVEAVEIYNGEAYVVIDDQIYNYEDIYRVESVDTYDNAESISQAMALIGKTIQAVTVGDGEGNGEEYIEGVVDFVKFVDGVPVLSVGGKDVYLGEVASISEDTLLLGKEITIEYNNEEYTGEITDILIDGDDIYVQVAGEKVQLEDLTSLVTSLQLIGKDVSCGDIYGEVVGIMIKSDTKPYLLVQMQDSDVLQELYYGELDSY